MTIENLRDLIADYRDILMGQLKTAKDGNTIRDFSKKLRMSEKTMEAIDGGSIRINGE